MAAPVAIASLVLGGLSAVGSAVGSVAQSRASRAEANYQSAVAANNAKIASYNAEGAVQAGQAAAATQGLKNRAALGALTAGEAAEGVDPNSGSPLAARVTERETGVEDVAQTEHNAMLQAYGFQNQATGYQAESTLEKSEAKQAGASLPFTVGTDLLSGASSLTDKWQGFQQKGVQGFQGSDQSDTGNWSGGTPV